MYVVQGYPHDLDVRTSYSAIGDKGKMAEQVENATLLINQAFEQLHQAIEERKKTLLSEMEAISLSKTTALSLQKKTLSQPGWTWCIV